MISREPREQRHLLDVLISNFVLAEGRLTVTWRKPFDVLAEAGSAENENCGDPEHQNRRHPVGSGGANAYRTAALDVEVCSSEHNLALKVVSGMVESAP